MKASGTNSAFTLFELLVVLAVTAFMTCALVPVIGRPNQDASAVQCVNNLRQLMNGCKMYSDDYQGRLVPNRPNSSLPNWVKGVIDFAPGNQANTNTGYLVGPDALLGPYVRSPVFFKCPADKSTVIMSSGLKPRVRSISMNGYVGTGSSGWNSAYRQYEKSVDIVFPTPANLFVLIDEHEDSIDDGVFYTSPTTSPTSDVIVDFPAARHNRGCAISFADGRVEIHEWRDARTMPPLGAFFTLNVPSPNNVDIEWLNERSSSRP